VGEYESDIKVILPVTQISNMDTKRFQSRTTTMVEIEAAEEVGAVEEARVVGEEGVAEERDGEVGGNLHLQLQAGFEPGGS
jgi:hypothetical protein